MKKQKEKNANRKKNKTTKNEKTDYCNPSFYRNKREKDKTKTKQKKQSEKQTKKASILLEKKKICLYVRKKILHAYWL